MRAFCSSSRLLLCGACLIGCSTSKNSVARFDPAYAPIVGGDTSGVVLEKPKKEKPTARMLTDFGSVQLSAGNYRKAGESFNQALKIDKKLDIAYVGLAKVHSAQNSPQEALSVLQTALQYHPESPLVWNEIAVVKARMKDYSGAATAMEKVMAKDPTNQAYLDNYAGILAMAGQPGKSYEIYSRLLNPADAGCRVANILLAQGRRQEAETYLRQVILVNPGHQEALALMAKMTSSNFQQVSHLGRTNDRVQ